MLLLPTRSSVPGRDYGAMYIASLFGSGVQGAVYRPRDLSTLFLDYPPTAPVTAMEQQVATMLDISGNGNHAFQATTTKRGVVSRRVNLLTKTEQFDGAVVWGANLYSNWVNAPVTPNAGVAPDGTLTADDLHLTLGIHNRMQWVQNIVPGASYVFKIQAMAAQAGNDYGTNGLVLRVATGTNGTLSVFDFATAQINPYLSESEFVTFSLPFTVPESGVTDFVVGISGGGGGTMDAKVRVWGASLTLATDSHLPYQRVNTATVYDADPNKFPTYIRFDGVDDGYQTNSIDFTGTDKMTVWAGLMRFGAGVQSIAELSANVGANTAAWWLESGGAAVDAFRFASRGSGDLGSAVSPAVASPASVVLTGQGNIAAPESRLRVSGAAYLSTAAQGAGTYGNYPLYIGDHAGTSFFFNGRLYSLIVRGAQTPLAQIEATELYIKQKMRMP